jgi:hypothetical protein
MKGRSVSTSRMAASKSPSGTKGFGPRYWSGLEPSPALWAYTVERGIRSSSETRASGRAREAATASRITTASLG